VAIPLASRNPRTSRSACLESLPDMLAPVDILDIDPLLFHL
jgi:hypothetical protein